MTDINHLAERHIRGHAARLQHVEELIERAHKGAGERAGLARVHTALDDLVREGGRQAVGVDDLRTRAAEQWRREEVARSGPMGIWDALAGKLEALVEKAEHRG